MTSVRETSQPTTSPARAATGRSLPRAVSFWLVAAMSTTLLAASSAPSPLYPVFQAEFGFSALTLTAIFAVYVLALLVSLLTVGRLSDFVGRRPVLAVALLVEAASMAVFLGADSTAWLVIARIVQGIATGAAIGVLGAYLLDLQPRDGSRLGSLVNSVAPTSGLGVGAMLTGVLVQYAPHPTKLVFAILTGLFVVLLLATAVLPETVQRVPGAVSALRPAIAVPAPARRAFLGAVPTMVATWALGGLILSVGGSLLEEVFGQANHAVVGLVIGVFAASAAAAAVLATNLQPPTMTRIGTVALAIGTILFVVALGTTSLGLFVVASVISGGGFGAGFLGSLRSVTQLVQPHERAGLLSAVYIVSYVAFSVPAVVAGVLITHEGLRDTAFGYGVFVAAITVVTLIVESVTGRPARARAVTAD
jgi:MFS family permease